MILESGKSCFRQGGITNYTRFDKLIGQTFHAGRSTLGQKLHLEMAALAKAPTLSLCIQIGIVYGAIYLCFPPTPLRIGYSELVPKSQKSFVSSGSLVSFKSRSILSQSAKMPLVPYAVGVMSVLFRFAGTPAFASSPLLGSLAVSK